MKAQLLDFQTALAHWDFKISRLNLAWHVLTGPKACGLVYDIRDRNKSIREALSKFEEIQNI
jgi:hypothetical protein